MDKRFRKSGQIDKGLLQLTDDAGGSQQKEDLDGSMVDFLSCWLSLKKLPLYIQFTIKGKDSISHTSAVKYFPIDTAIGVMYSMAEKKFGSVLERNQLSANEFVNGLVEHRDKESMLIAAWLLHIDSEVLSGICGCSDEDSFRNELKEWIFYSRGERHKIMRCWRSYSFSVGDVGESDKMNKIVEQHISSNRSNFFLDFSTELC